MRWSHPCAAASSKPALSAAWPSCSPACWRRRSWRGNYAAAGGAMNPPPIDFNGLDSTVHGPVRLGVLTALQIDGPLDFTTLKKHLQVADGTLGLHLEKLE